MRQIPINTCEGGKEARRQRRADRHARSGGIVVEGVKGETPPVKNCADAVYVLTDLDPMNGSDISSDNIHRVPNRDRNVMALVINLSIIFLSTFQLMALRISEHTILNIDDGFETILTPL